MASKGPDAMERVSGPRMVRGASCLRCKTMKCKCDGQRPCGRCARQGKHCQPQPPLKRCGWKRQTVMEAMAESRRGVADRPPTQPPAGAFTSKVTRASRMGSTQLAAQQPATTFSASLPAENGMPHMASGAGAFIKTAELRIITTATQATQLSPKALSLARLTPFALAHFETDTWPIPGTAELLFPSPCLAPSHGRVNKANEVIVTTTGAEGCGRTCSGAQGEKQGALDPWTGASESVPTTERTAAQAELWGEGDSGRNAGFDGGVGSWGDFV